MKSSTPRPAAPAPSGATLSLFGMVLSEMLKQHPLPNQKRTTPPLPPSPLNTPAPRRTDAIPLPDCSWPLV